MGIKFDSKVVKEFFKETCKLGGNTKEIDTKLERNTLSEYLANNKDNMSIGDIATFNTYLKETTADNNATQPKDVEVNVVGDNNNTQVAVGNNNDQNINVYYGTKPVEQKKEEVPVKETTTKTDKPVKKDKPAKTDEPKKDEPLKSLHSIDKPKTSNEKLDLTGTYFDDSGKMRSKDGNIYRYAFYINLQPGPNVQKDLNYIKQTVNENLSQIRGYKTIVDQLNSMNSKEEIQDCLKSHGIELNFVY